MHIIDRNGQMRIIDRDGPVFKILTFQKKSYRPGDLLEFPYKQEKNNVLFKIVDEKPINHQQLMKIFDMDSDFVRELRLLICKLISGDLN